MNYKKLFKQISDSEIEYFVSDYCDETQKKSIKEHVERQIAERLKNADDKQKNTNFIIALIYDQGSSDNYTQQKRIEFQTVDLLEKIRRACYDSIRPFGKCRDQNRKLQDITHFIESQNIIGSIREHLQRQDIDMATFKESLKNIYCVANKLTDWSITNVTGKEYVIDTHIARVLYRLAVISKCEYKGYKTHWLCTSPEIVDTPKG